MKYRNDFFSSVGYSSIRNQRITQVCCTEHNSGISMMLCVKYMMDPSTIIFQWDISVWNGFRKDSVKFTWPKLFICPMRTQVCHFSTTTWWLLWLITDPLCGGQHVTGQRWIPLKNASNAGYIFCVLDSTKCRDTGDLRGHGANMTSL